MRLQVDGAVADVDEDDEPAGAKLRSRPRRAD